MICRSMRDIEAKKMKNLEYKLQQQVKCSLVLLWIHSHLPSPIYACTKPNTLRPRKREAKNQEGYIMVCKRKKLILYSVRILYITTQNKLFQKHSKYYKLFGLMLNNVRVYKMGIILMKL